jgi:hypothetical protein
MARSSGSDPGTGGKFRSTAFYCHASKLVVEIDSMSGSGSTTPGGRRFWSASARESFASPTPKFATISTLALAKIYDALRLPFE